MTQNDHLKQLSEIRDIMEKSSRFISLSGLSGVFAGVFAMIGAMAFYFYSKNLGIDVFNLNDVIRFPFEISLIKFAIIDGLIILILSIGTGIFFTTRKAKRKGLQIWHNTTWRLIINLAIPLATGGIICIAFVYYGFYCFIGPFTLIFYGLGLLNCSKYTLDEVRYLGISEIILGLISLFIIGCSMVYWIIGFGFLHIIYGWYMYKKHG